MAWHIVITDYNPFWKDMFEIEASIIKTILDKDCIAIYHSR